MTFNRNIKRNLCLYLVCLGLFIVGCLSFNTSNSKEKNPPKEKILITLINYILTNGHYQPKKIDDNFSKKVYKKFLNYVDFYKRYFLQEDIKEFKIHETLIDQEIKNGMTSFYNLVMNRFKIRLKESKKYYNSILKDTLNFTKNDSVNLNFEKRTFTKDTIELKNFWKKQIKLNILRKLSILKGIEQNKYKKDKTYKKKSLKTMEKQARKETLENLIENQKTLEKLKDSDWFSTYMNAIASTFDPHTSYLSPSTKDRFDSDISGKIEGIGAVLQNKNDYIKVVRVVQGGPAWKQGELEAGDLIIRVAQEKDKSIDGQRGIDIAGMHINEVIKLIKGKKGTKVILTIKKIDNTFKDITIKRDIVELENTYLKSAITHKNDKKYGVIHLPKFYIDFKNRNYRNAASDMEKVLYKFNEENVQGIVIDLRDNGGGALKTAVDIGGFFIKKGAIVQIKSRDKKPIIQSDNNSKIQWKKPVIILVNELSASASEILAAALQDYKRAIIMGSKKTFGKGTVQNLLGLNDYYQYNENLGTLKLTIQKFYRINGVSTQLKGVTPDIIFPSKLKYIPTGEQEEKEPLQWDKIPAAKYEATNSYKNYKEVIQASQKRIANNKHFQLIDKYAKLLSEEKKQYIYPLNLKKYINQEKSYNEKFKAFKNIKYQSNLKFELPNFEKNDTIIVQKRKIWQKDLSQDLVLEEALEVLSQLRQ